MAYTDIISVDDAKIYLRIDDTLTEDDQFITRTINAAFTWIEKRTNVIVDAKDKTYDIINSYARIYDYPINTDLSTETDYTFTKKGLYYIVCANNSETTELTLNVGEADPNNVDPEFLNVAYEIIDFFYNQSKSEENKGKAIMDYLSPMSTEFINLNRRFII